MSFLVILFIHNNDCKTGKIIRNADTEKFQNCTEYVQKDHQTFITGTVL